MCLQEAGQLSCAREWSGPVLPRAEMDYPLSEPGIRGGLYPCCAPVTARRLCRQDPQACEGFRVG